MSEPVRKRSTSAERTRDYRARRACGSTLIRLIITADGASELIRLGWLSADRARDPVAIADAVLALAGDAAGKGIRPPRARAHA